ncbi:MAG: ABC transporter substrate-binding protein [Methylobacterium mesophilicum]|nr:ABC transporter substrate-binding protein [Methylobacterium mesophilicum]
MRNWLLASVAGAAVVASGSAWADIKIGVMATLEGTYTVLGEDAMRGFQVAMKEYNNQAGGQKLQYIVASTDTTPESAVRAARKLVEQDGVTVIVGPLSGSEGIAMRDFAKQNPNITVINGLSGAQEATMVDPAPNFFRYNMDGAQWGAGLGDYVYNEKGWKTVASVAEDYSFGYTNFMGFALGFCQAGGEITQRQWVPLGTKDFASIIAALPDDVDALYIGLGGGDAVNFLNQYQQAGGNAHLIGGTIMVDGTVLNAKGDAKKALIGTPSGGPQADMPDDPAWEKFVKQYQDDFPADKRFPSPSLFATGYYNSTIATLKALDAAGGDISGDQKKFREALQNVQLDAPNGHIKLDANRQAIGTNFISEVQEGPDGTLVNKLVKKVADVNQTLGLDEATFKSIGLPSRDTPECKKYK